MMLVMKTDFRPLKDAPEEKPIMALWKFDPAHASAQFAARHMMVMTVRGSFKKLDGFVEYDPANPAAARVEATIDAASIDTAMADRDNHLRSPDFLDVANFPTITFKSTKVTPKGGDRATITGDLTIRGVTRSVELDAELVGMSVNPFTKANHAGFSASTKINREDWGLTWNVALEAGGVLVGKDIGITLDVEVIQQVAAVPA
jgi:polyisoprenoid-binding protein YceI